MLSPFRTKLASRFATQFITRSCTKLSESSSWSTNKMSLLLDDHNFDTRNKLRELAKDPLFVPKYNITLQQDRQLAYDRIKKICSLGIISIKDFEKNPRNIFAAHEIVGMLDGSVCTKMTVQFNLFGGTLLKLGTEFHHQLVSDIDKFNVVGCFGLTELAYGNNAVEMETTAHYNKNTNQFVINSPTTNSQKYWITNGAIHAHHCIVFAKLYMDDGAYEGIHAFLVRIRDHDMNLMERCKIWDLGRKIGLNGIDNAALWFDHVEIPAANLLNAYSKIIDGKFTSIIVDQSKRKRKRFIKIADQLLSGRVCIASMSLGSTKLVLDGTIKFAASRLAVGKDGYSTSPILSFQAHQNKLMPLIAKTYALNFCLSYVQSQYHLTKISNQNLVKLCCMIKPLISSHALDVASVCRQLCGGQGYLEANRFGEAIAGAHAGITAEGDNIVMQQKIAKEILDEFSHELKADKFNTIIKIGTNYITCFTRFTRFTSNTNPVNINELLKHRENSLKYSLAMKLKGVKADKLYDEWMHNHSNLIQDLAVAYSHRITSEEFLQVINSSDDQMKRILTDLYKLYALSEIKRDGTFYLGNKFISIRQFAHIETEIQNLCKTLGMQANKLVEGFGIPFWMHHSPMVTGLENYNKIENNGELTKDDKLIKNMN